MSQENVEIVWRAFDAFNRGDIDPARLASGCGRASRVRMTAAAKMVWTVLAVLLILFLIGGALTLMVQPGN